MPTAKLGLRQLRLMFYMLKTDNMRLHSNVWPTDVLRSQSVNKTEQKAIGCD